MQKTLQLKPLDVLEKDYVADAESITKYYDSLAKHPDTELAIEKEREAKQSALWFEYETRKNFISSVGSEYAGTYTVKSLMASEYLAMMEELIAAKRSESQLKGEDWTGDIPATEVRKAIVYKSTSKDGQPLPTDVPAKLFELLASVAVPMNSLDLAEQQALFQLFR
jgi:hypothetical protein